MGGLGNQLFQYAAGRRICHVLNSEQKLDTSWFQHDTSRDYSLQNFNIKAAIADKDEISIYKKKRSGILDRFIMPMLFRKHSAQFNDSYFKEKFFNFDPEVFSLRDNVYIDGYWQSEKYFVDIEPIIRQEFRIMRQQSKANFKLGQSIRSKESVSVHVRRGDYVSNSLTNSVLGTCDLSYYYRSIEKISSFTKNLHYYIFSDEPAWARAHLKLPYDTTFIKRNSSDKAYEDLRLMSMCKHHIIANSSFSWWGAWLNPNPNKIVIAPLKWFKNPEINTRDLPPKSWIRL
jgi:hypothetical protein